MTKPTQEPQVPAQEPQVTPAAEPSNTDTLPMIPKSRFDEVNTERQQLREQLAEYERKRKEEETRRLEQQGEFKKLADERQAEIERLTAYEAQVKELTEAARASNDKLIEQVPEEKRGLIPDYEPLRLQAWLSQNRDFLIGPAYTPPNTQGGAGSYQRPGNGQHKPLSQTELAIAANMGLTPEQYQEGVAKLKTNKQK